MTIRISLRVAAFVVYTLALVGGAFGISYAVFEWRDDNEDVGISAVEAEAFAIVDIKRQGRDPESNTAEWLEKGYRPFCTANEPYADGWLVQCGMQSTEARFEQLIFVSVSGDGEVEGFPPE